MSSTGLEMRQNRFRPGLCPGPHWGSLQRSPRPHSWWGGGWLPPPQKPQPALALRASGFRCVVHQTPPNINPSYGLAYGIPSCITHRPLCTYQISMKSDKLLWTDVWTDVPTDRRTLGRLAGVDLIHATPVSPTVTVKQLSVVKLSQHYRVGQNSKPLGEAITFDC